MQSNRARGQRLRQPAAYSAADAGSLGWVIVETLPNAAEVAVAVAEHVEQSLQNLGGASTLGLAGGSTPRAAYAALRDREIAWEDVTMWLGDERWVAHHHPESNVGMVRGALVDHVHGQLLAPNHGIGDPHTAAAAYETSLAAAFIDRGAGKAPDIVLLGIGDDGHTASLFPGTAAVEETDSGYVANWVATKEAWRLTATIPLLVSAGELVFIATGAGKAGIVREILVDAAPYPAQQVAAGADNVVWYLDAAAAAAL